jgi:hypothetical protein
LKATIGVVLSLLKINCKPFLRVCRSNSIIYQIPK